MDEATLREYYGRVFEYAIKEGNAQSIMTSYNRINGKPASVNDFLLTTLLREEWGFDGFVVSDCGAVADCYINPMFSNPIFGNPGQTLGHFYAKSMEEASAMTLIAGTDISCGTEHKKALLNAVKLGYIGEDIIDRALIRALTTRFRLGLFDEAGKVPYNRFGKEKICAEEMKAFSVDMANDTIVLLKNDKNLLPLSPEKAKSILVIGPNALYRQLGGYSAGQSPKVDTVVNVMALEGIKAEGALPGIEVIYEKGWCAEAEFRKGGPMDLPGVDMVDILSAMDILPPGLDAGALKKLGEDMRNAKPRFTVDDPDYQAEGEKLFARALEKAKKADLVIVVAGTDNFTASEEHDRETLALPYGQDEKIQKLLEANSNTVVVLTTLGAVTGDFFEKAHTVVNAHFAGQEQGTAIANILFGKINPNAKLSATWYKRQEDLPHINDYGIKKQDTLDKKARTYMYFDGDVLFPFGHGLSYTAFEYRGIKVEKTALDANESLKVSVDVKNTGARKGKEIVQLYIAKVIPEGMRDNKPFRQLKNFTKIELEPGETKTVELITPLKEVTFWSNRLQKMVVEAGTYTVEVGGSSANLPRKSQFTVSGEWKAKLFNVYAVAEKYIYQIGAQGKIRVSAVLEDAAHLCPDAYHAVFVSSDESVATVDERGIVTARAQGTATITAALTWHGVTKQSAVPVAVK
ncbi:MAG: glycoside hydrolase family 3 C-terminal domain-containing protein [Treponema sp.]|nr:glycoside hydrolase family 3 C-terminal domain-containing protein [Treponema sp.]